MAAGGTPQIPQATQIPQTQVVAIADSLFAAVTEADGTRLSLDQIDALLVAAGFRPIPRGRLGRDDWNFFRLRLIVRVNRHLRATHQVTLKVTAHNSRTPLYGLVSTSVAAVRAPWNTTKGYESRLRRDLRALYKEYLDQHELPEDADTNSLKSFYDILDRRFATHIDLIVDDIILAARAAGLLDRLPAAASRPALPVRRSMRRLAAPAE